MLLMMGTAPYCGGGGDDIKVGIQRDESATQAFALRRVPLVGH